MTPCYLIVRDLLHWTRHAAAQCARLGFRPVLVNCGTTYGPTLEWLASAPYEVLKAAPDGGPLAAFRRGLAGREGGFYAVTDPDLDLSGVPEDAGRRLRTALVANPGVRKAGLSLEYRDLPDGYPFRAEVEAVEGKYWRTRTPDGNWLAPTDTTFALYHRGRDRKVADFYSSVRLDRPYTARHRPWYLPPGEGGPDYLHYVAHAVHAGFWTRRTRLYGGAPC